MSRGEISRLQRKARKQLLACKGKPAGLAKLPSTDRRIRLIQAVLLLCQPAYASCANCLAAEAIIVSEMLVRARMTASGCNQQRPMNRAANIDGIEQHQDTGVNDDSCS